MTPDASHEGAAEGEEARDRAVAALVATISNSILRIGACYLHGEQTILVTGAAPLTSPEARERAEKFAAAHRLSVRVTAEMLIFRRPSGSG